MLDQANQIVGKVAQTYEGICKRYWQESRDAVLKDIIADKATFDEETEQLKLLKQELIKTKDLI